MNLYLLSQTQNNDYDTYDSMVVCAATKDKARMIHPRCEWGDAWTGWCKTPQDVTVQLIGKAIKGTKEGVVLASCNAG